MLNAGSPVMSSAAEPDRAGARRDEPAHDSCDRRLPGAVRTEQRHDRACGHPEGDSEQRPVRAVGSADVLEIEQVDPSGSTATRSSTDPAAVASSLRIIRDVPMQLTVISRRYRRHAVLPR